MNRTSVTQTLSCLLLTMATLAAPAVARADCEADNQCKGDRVCIDGTCQAAPEGSTCAADVDCPGDEICTAGRCVLPGAAPAPPPEPPPPAPAPAPLPSPDAQRPDGAGPEAPPPAAAADPSAPPAAAVVGGNPAYPAGRPDGATRTEPITPLIIAGSVVLGSAYVIGIATTAVIGTVTEGDNIGRDVGFLAIPVVGSFVLLGVEADNSDYDDYRPALVVNGILQTGGLVMLILGATLQREVEAEVGWGDTTLQLKPSAPYADGGLSITGQF